MKLCDIVSFTTKTARDVYFDASRAALARLCFFARFAHSPPAQTLTDHVAYDTAAVQKLLSFRSHSGFGLRHNFVFPHGTQFNDRRPVVEHIENLIVPVDEWK